MNSARATVGCVAIGALVACAGCMAPGTFVKTPQPAWAAVEIRPDIPYEKAWEGFVDSLVKKFDVEVISKENGYIRTGWCYSWTGKTADDYRVRVTAKFSPDHGRVEVKSEAEYGGPGKWVPGYDRGLLESMKKDLESSIGKTGK